jgi:hypothetical protein
VLSQPAVRRYTSPSPCDPDLPLYMLLPLLLRLLLLLLPLLLLLFPSQDVAAGHAQPVPVPLGASRCRSDQSLPGGTHLWLPQHHTAAGQAGSAVRARTEHRFCSGMWETTCAVVQCCHLLCATHICWQQYDCCLARSSGTAHVMCCAAANFVELHPLMNLTLQAHCHLFSVVYWLLF